MTSRTPRFQPSVLRFLATLIVASSLATLTPWGLSLVAIRGRAIAWTAAAFGALVLFFATRAVRQRPGRLEAALEPTLLVLALALLAWMWHEGGGILAPLLLAPLLLLSFGIGAFRGRGTAIWVGVLAWVVAVFVVLLESRDVRRDVIHDPTLSRWLKRMPLRPRLRRG